MCINKTSFVLCVLAVVVSVNSLAEASVTEATITLGYNLFCQLTKVPDDFSGRVCYYVDVQATANAGTGIYVNNTSTHVMQFMNNSITNYRDPNSLRLHMDFYWERGKKKLANQFSCGKCDRVFLGSCLSATTVSCKGNIAVVGYSTETCPVSPEPTHDGEEMCLC